MNDIQATSIFPKGYRASGVALDCAALPSPHGIGDVGPSALKWVDRLHEAGQSWWHAVQSRSRYCESVYRPFSSFAGDPLLISPDWLIEDGLLTSHDCDCVALPSDSIDYDVVVPFKHWLLDKAWKTFNSGARKDLRASYEGFRKKQAHWLEDYALFCALKTKYRGAPYSEWPSELSRRNAGAIWDARRELTNEIDQVRFSQYVLFRQTQRLKEYASKKGVRLIGDLPFFISADSSEAWANPELFVDEQRSASPDGSLVPVCFSSSDALCSADRGKVSRVSYRWCVDRLRALLAHVHVARVDVRALAAPWHEAGDAPAIQSTEDGRDEYSTGVGGLIADGRALDPKDGFAFRDTFRVPETRVIQLAFGDPSDKPPRPQNFTANSAVYTGMHDGARSRAWFNELPDHQRRALSDYLERPSVNETEVAWELIRLAWSSSAALAMVTLPDLLNLGEDLMDQDGAAKGHRRWRCSEEMFSAPAFYWLRELTKRSNRWAETRSTARPATFHRPAQTRIGVAL